MNFEIYCCRLQIQIVELDFSNLTSKVKCRLILGDPVAQNLLLVYRTRAIITRGLYIFDPIFEGQKPFLRVFFKKILSLGIVSIQEQFQIKGGL